MIRQLCLYLYLLFSSAIVFADEFFTLPLSDVDGSFEISWPSNANATEYLLQLSWTTELGKIKRKNLYRGLNTSFTVENLEKGLYRFRLLSYCQGYSQCADWENYSNYVEVGNIWTLPKETDVNSVDVIWQALEGVELYSLEMSSDNKTWLEVYRGTNTSVHLAELTNGLYQFRLIPLCFEQDCEVQYSDAFLSSEVMFVNVPRVDNSGAPVVLDDFLYLSEDYSQLVNVKTNDYDPQGDNFALAGLQSPSNGKIEVVSSSQIKYTPNKDFCGQDAFGYRMRELYGNRLTSKNARVYVYIECLNDGPIAVDDVAYTIDFQSKIIDVIANDHDVEGDEIVISQVEALNQYNDQVEIVNNKVRYTNKRYCDNANIELGFIYYISDIYGAKAPNNESQGKVNVQVSCDDLVPIANNDTVNMHSMQSMLIDVLANDVEPEKMALAVSRISTQPKLGHLAIQDNQIKYTPNSGQCGQDFFEYIAVDETDNESMPAKVDVFIECMGAVDDTMTFDEGGSFQLDLTENDIFPQGERAIVQAIVQPPVAGIVEVNGNVATYTTYDKQFCGTDSFIYSAKSANGLWSDSGRVNITINCVNDVPVATNDTAVTALNTSVFIDVKSNDSDADNNNFIVSRVLSENTTYGHIVIENGGIRYTPNTGYCGNAIFHYFLDDGNGVESSAASVFVDVCGIEESPDSKPKVPDAPIAKYDEGTLVVNWNPISGASFFNLEVSRDSGVSWSSVALNVIGNSYVDTHLENGSYIYRISACNTHGCSMPSLISSPVGSEVLPPPENFSVVLVNGDLTVSWHAVESATDYILKLSTDNGLTWVHEYSLGNVLSYNRTEVVDGAFVFKLKACNEVTCSSYTPTSSPVGTQALPIPSNVVATIYDRKLTVTWDKVQGATHYDLQSLSADGSLTEYNLGDVEEYLREEVVDGEFQFRVRSCNSVTCSGYSNYSASVGTDTLSVPTNVIAKISNQRLQVTWDKVNGSEYSVLQLSTNNGESWIVQDPYNTENSYFRSNIADGHFTFRVKACTSVTCSNYSQVSNPVGSQSIPAPEEVIATLFDGNLNVSWSAVQNATYYILEVEDDIGSIVSHVLENVVSYERTEVIDGAFVFRVQACNEYACGSFSSNSQVVGTSAISPPASISATVTTEALLVNWGSVEGSHYQLRQSLDNGQNWTSLVDNSYSNQFSRSENLVGQFLFQVRACNEVTCSAYATLAESVGLKRAVLSGEPQSKIIVEQLYKFVPTASEFNEETLLFSIANKPHWAEFDAVTGALTGTPDKGDVGVVNAIRIFATDGTQNAELPEFSIQVQLNGIITSIKTELLGVP